MLQTVGLPRKGHRRKLLERKVRYLPDYRTESTPTGLARSQTRLKQTKKIWTQRRVEGAGKRGERGIGGGRSI